MRAAHAASASGAMPRILPGRFLPNRPCGPSLRVRASRSRTAEWAAPTSLPIWRIARPLFLRQAASSVIFWLAGLFFAAGALQAPLADPRHEAILGWSLLGLPLFPVWQCHFDATVRIACAFQSKSCAWLQCGRARSQVAPRAHRSYWRPDFNGRRYAFPLASFIRSETRIRAFSISSLLAAQ